MANGKFYTFGKIWGSVNKKYPFKMFLDKLRNEPLDPKYELIGNFIIRQTEYNTISTYKKHLNMVQFYGQFYDNSMKFNILVSDDRLIGLLTQYIRSNQSSTRYKDLRKSCNVFDPEPLSRFNMHIKRDVILPTKHHIEPIIIWIVSADIGFQSFILKMGGERILDKFRFYSNPTTKLVNFIAVLGDEKHLNNVNDALDNTISNIAKHSHNKDFSRRQMREDTDLSYKYIGERILAAQKSIKRITSKLNSGEAGPHSEYLKNNLEQYSKNLSYWVCVSQQKGTTNIALELFVKNNIAIVDGYKTTITDVQKHLVVVECLDDKYIGMTFHYPHAAFTEVYSKKQKLLGVA